MKISLSPRQCLFSAALLASLGTAMSAEAASPNHPVSLKANAAPLPNAASTPARNVLIFVCDGLRAGSVNPDVAPALSALRDSGVRFANSHSVFPTFTTANASAIATGHYLGDTSDFSNFVYAGYPIFDTGNFGNKPGTMTPFLENDQLLSDVDDHYRQNYLTEETLLSYARAHGYNTAAIGKLGPILIQDVTQGNLDHASGKVPAPDTVIIDDATGWPAGVPLSSAMADALAKAGLPIQTPKRGANGDPGDHDRRGTLVPNTVQQAFFADVASKAVLPAFAASGKPFVMVYWSRDPDGTQHNHGDSVGRLVPGINGPTCKAAVTNVDNNLAQVIASLKANGLYDSTDIFVTADHGFNTISHHEVDAAGTVTSSYAAGFTYRNADGRVEVDRGFTPGGFLAIDLAHFLQLPLFDPDMQVDVDGARRRYKPVDPTLPQATAAVSQKPASGNGLIGGTGAIAAPTDARVVVAANGGSDLVYLPNGPQSQRIADANRIVDFLTRQDYVSGIFADDALGKIPGALPLRAINLKGVAQLPTPALVVNFRSFSTDAADSFNTAVEFGDNPLQEGQGTHGSFDRGDTLNFMAAIGPDFKHGYVDDAPVSNADVQVTLAKALGFRIPHRGSLLGRVIDEAFAGAPDIRKKSVSVRTIKSAPAANGMRTLLRCQQYGKSRYFDAAGFEGRTVGL